MPQPGVCYLEIRQPGTALERSLPAGLEQPDTPACWVAPAGPRDSPSGPPLATGALSSGFTQPNRDDLKQASRELVRSAALFERS